MENQINKTNTMPPALEAIDLPASQKEELLVAYESIFLKKELQIPEDILGRVDDTIALIESMKRPETVRPEIDEIINAMKIGIKGIEQSGTKEFIKRDADYYLNKYLAKADLEAFAKDLSKKTGKSQTILDLNTRNIQKLEIICTTGEKVKGPTYLNNAGKCLLEDDEKFSGKDVLKKLIQIAGIESENKIDPPNPDLFFTEQAQQNTQILVDAMLSTINQNLSPEKHLIFDEKFSTGNNTPFTFKLGDRPNETYQTKFSAFIRAITKRLIKELENKYGKNNKVKVSYLLAREYLLLLYQEENVDRALEIIFPKAKKEAEESENEIDSPDYDLFFTDQAQQNTQILVEAMLSTINQNLSSKDYLIFDEKFSTGNNTPFTFKLGDKPYQTNFSAFIQIIARQLSKELENKYSKNNKIEISHCLARKYLFFLYQGENVDRALKMILESENEISSPKADLFFTDQAQQNTQILVDAMLNTINQNLPPKAHLIFDESFSTNNKIHFTFKLDGKSYQIKFSAFIQSIAYRLTKELENKYGKKNKIEELFVLARKYLILLYQGESVDKALDTITQEINKDSGILSETKNLNQILQNLPANFSREYLSSLINNLEKISSETDNPKIAKFLKTLQSFMQGKLLTETTQTVKKISLSALWQIQQKIADLLDIKERIDIDANFIYHYFYEEYLTTKDPKQFKQYLEAEMLEASPALKNEIQQTFDHIIQMRAIKLLKDTENNGFELFPYQLHGADHLNLHNCTILGFEAGLGKTATTSTALEMQFRRAELTKQKKPKVLIVAGLNAHQQWHNDLQRLNSYDYQGENDPQIKVVSPQKLLAQTKKNGHLQQVTKKTIKELYGDYDIVVIDDLFKYDNPSEDNQTNFILKNIPAKIRWGLTGNLYQRHPLYLYNLFNIIDPQKYPDYKYFCREMKKNPAIIQQLINTNILRYTQEIVFPENIEGFKPPEIIHENTAISLDKDYYNLLDKLASNMQSFRGGLITINKKVNQNRNEDEPKVKHGVKETDFTEFGKLRWYQYITNHPEDFGLKDYKLEKLKADIGGKGKEKATAIFCEHTKTINKLVHELKLIYGEDMVGRYDGTNQSTRNNDLQSFQAGEKKIIVLNHNAGGSGLTLTKADQGIHYEAPKTNTQMEQTNLRLSRVDTKNPKESITIKKYIPLLPEKTLSSDEKKYFANGLPEAIKYETFEIAKAIDNSLWDSKQTLKDTDYKIYAKLHTWFEDDSIKEMRKKLKIKNELKQIKEKHASEQPHLYMFRDILQAENNITNNKYEKIFTNADNLSTFFNFIKKSVLSPKTFNHKHVRDIVSYALPPEIKANLLDKGFNQINTETQPVLNMADLTDLSQVFEFRNKFSVATFLSHFKILLNCLETRGEKLGEYLDIYANKENLTEKRVPIPIRIMSLLIASFDGGDFSSHETVIRNFLQKINNLPEKEIRNQKNYDDLFSALSSLIEDIPYYLGPHDNLTPEEKETRSEKYTLFINAINQIVESKTTSFKDIIFAIRNLGFILQFGHQSNLGKLATNNAIEDLKFTKLNLLQQTILPEMKLSEFLQYYEKLADQYKQKPYELEDDLTSICVFLKRYKQYANKNIDYGKQYLYFKEVAKLFFTGELTEARKNNEHITKIFAKETWEAYHEDQISHYTVKTVNNKQEKIEMQISVEDSSKPNLLLRSGSKYYGFNDCHNEFAFPDQNRCVAEVALNPAIKIAVVRNKKGKPIAIGRIKLRADNLNQEPCIHIEKMMNNMDNLPVEELLAHHFKQTRDNKIKVTIPSDISLQTTEIEEYVNANNIQNKIITIKNPTEIIKLEPGLNISGVEYVEDLHHTCYADSNFHLKNGNAKFSHQAKPYQNKPACIVEAK